MADEASAGGTVREGTGVPGVASAASSQPASQRPAVVDDDTDDIVWRQIRDEASGEFYFHNLRTNETTWEKPQHFPYADASQSKPAAQEAAPKPVKWTPIAGTDWQRVLTDTGEEYYFNAMTNVTSWDLPEQLASLPPAVLRGEQPAQQPNPQAQMARMAQMQMMPPGMPMMAHGMPMMAPGMPMMPPGMPGMPMMAGMKRQAIAMPGMLQPQAKRQKMSEEDMAFERRLQMLRSGRKMTPAEEMAEARARPEREKREQQRLAREEEERKRKEEEEREERQRKQETFRSLLRDHKITQFSMWDAVVTKLAQDDRFKAISTASERKEVFEEYAKERASKQQEERQEAEKALNALIAKATSEGILEYADFEEKYGQEAGFSLHGSLSEKLRKAAFDEVAGPLRKLKKKEEVESKAGDREMFIGMLRDYTWIRHDSSWTDTRRRLRRDSSRYSKCRLSSDEKEDLFRDHVKKLQRTYDREERVRRLEREARRRRERERQDLEMRTRRNRREEATADFKCLLEEMVKKNATWREARERLSHMPRFLTRDLSESEKERLFEDHLYKLERKAHDRFFAFLDESPRITLGCDYEEAEALVEEASDSRATCLAEDRREAVFREVQTKLLNSAKDHFRQLLEEDVKKITPAKSGQHFDNALRLMRKDKRWQALAAFPEVRDELILAYAASP